MFTIIYKPEAIDDIFEAAKWYNSQQEGLEERFFDDLDKLITYLETNPYLTRKFYGKTHQAPLRVFPYVVLYRIESKNVIIFSVFNCYQNPKKKKKRLK